MDLFRPDLDVRPPRGVRGTVSITLNCIARCIQHPETALADNPASVSLFAVLANTTKVYFSRHIQHFGGSHGVSGAVLAEVPIGNF